VDRGGQHALVEEEDARLDLVGRHAAVLPDHADDGDVDLREDVRGHAVDADRAEDGDQQGRYHERVRPPQCQPNDPHRSPLPQPLARATAAPAAPRKGRRGANDLRTTARAIARRLRGPWMSGKRWQSNGAPSPARLSENPAVERK